MPPTINKDVIIIVIIIIIIIIIIIDQHKTVLS